MTFCNSAVSSSLEGDQAALYLQWSTEEHQSTKAHTRMEHRGLSTLQWNTLEWSTLHTIGYFSSPQRKPTKLESKIILHGAFRIHTLSGEFLKLLLVLVMLVLVLVEVLLVVLLLLLLFATIVCLQILKHCWLVLCHRVGKD